MSTNHSSDSTLSNHSSEPDPDLYREHLLSIPEVRLQLLSAFEDDASILVDEHYRHDLLEEDAEVLVNEWLDKMHALLMAPHRENIDRILARCQLRALAEVQSIFPNKSTTTPDDIRSELELHTLFEFREAFFEGAFDHPTFQPLHISTSVH